MNRNEYKNIFLEWNRLLFEEKSIVSVDRILEIIDSVEEISKLVGKNVKIKYGLDQEYGRVEYIVLGDKISGAIDFERITLGRELGDFFIFETFPITSGYGPLLYEILIEKATENGFCLMPDQNEVSVDARRVWDKYFERSGVDIEFKQIKGDVSSSLSKCYSKIGQLFILDRLRNSEFIDFIEQ
jgi:hypothetical protein